MLFRSGTTTNRLSPVAISGTLSSGVTAVSAGSFHSLAIRNGGVYAWGQNGHGELGDGTTYGLIAPEALSGTLSKGVTAIACGDSHSLAIQNGGVYAWGNNSYGQVGDGTTTNQHTPEQIDPTDLHNIIAIAAANVDSYALSSDGSLWTWGYNGFGELGLGNTTNFQTPKHLLPPSGYVFTSISANNDGFHALATLTAIPEPASLSLFALGGVAILRRNRKHRAK